MNFIRIGKNFIHLDEVKAISVNSVRQSEVTATITYKDDTTMTIIMESGYDRLDMVTITPEVLAMSIQDAIEYLGDCDCENVGDYIEDNAEMLEDNE
jgi:hypothetical protein